MFFTCCPDEYPSNGDPVAGRVDFEDSLLLGELGIVVDTFGLFLCPVLVILPEVRRFVDNTGEGEPVVRFVDVEVESIFFLTCAGVFDDDETKCVVTVVVLTVDVVVGDLELVVAGVDVVLTVLVVGLLVVVVIFVVVSGCVVVVVEVRTVVDVG